MMHPSKMIKLITVVLFLCSLVAVKADFCQPSYVLGDFPEGIINDMYMSSRTGDVPDFKRCADNVTIDSEKLGLWFNHKANPDQPIRLNLSNPTEIDPSKPMLLLIHGWLCNITSTLMPELKDAYLKRYGDVNVIRVEWTTYATDRYVNSYCYIPKIAELLGNFLCHLNINFNKTHIVGHSMGAQVAGLTGKEVQKQCSKKIGRITGLDPAGPIYQKLNTTQRLYKTDAAIVDVIHTNQGQLGFQGPLGTVDFYPNCGFFQPNSMSLSQRTTLEDMKPLPLNTLIRSHILSAEYMVESISFDAFKAVSCSNCGLERGCTTDVDDTSEIIMGEHLSNVPDLKTNYLVITNGVKPYARDFICN